jgi:hypothetical protein
MPWVELNQSPNITITVNGLRVEQIDFDHTMTEVDLITINANGILVGVDVEIIDAWEAGKTLTVGDGADVDRVIAVNEIDLTQQNVYSFNVNLRYNVERIVKLYLSATSSTGSGKITLVYDTAA